MTHLRSYRTLVATLACCAALSAHAQAMLQSIRTGWSTFIFVSTDMPRETLVSLAQEASLAGATLVFRGFAVADGAAGRPIDLPALQMRIADIDAQCCHGRKVAWMVDPKLFDRYSVSAAPSFCLAWGEGNAAQDFSLVSGDMALANALKFMTQESALPGIRKRAAALYDSAFGGHS